MPLLSPGDDFGKYRIVGLLGQGGMGVVYLALDTTLERHVALKVLGGPAAHDPQFESRLRQEAKIIAQLEHPNIVQIHSLERIGSELAIDMAYVDGGPMSGVPASVEALVHVAVEVLDALAWCHDLGIVHRDVKPNNILLSRQGRALLTDFGLAKLLGEQQTTLQLSVASSCFFLGTPFYAPPESWDSNRPTPAWDVYSVGMVLYERLSPVTPYTAGTPLAFLKQLSNVRLQPLREINEDVSPPLSEAIARMLSHDAAQRPQNAREALALLSDVPEAVADPAHPRRTPIAVRPTVRAVWNARKNSALRTDSPVRRNATRIALAAVLTLAVVALAAFVVRGGNGGGELVPPDRVLRAANAVSFDSVQPATRQVRRAHWILKRVGIGEWDILAAGTSSLWVMHARAQGERDLRIEGHWAEYQDAGGLVFRHGALSGTGTWLMPLREMAVSLELTSALDFAQSTEALVLTASAEQLSPGQFVRRLDSADFIPALVYQELYPRAPDWLAALDSVWFADVAHVVRVIRMRDGADTVAVDGKLDEPAWKTGQPALPANDNASAMLTAVYDADAVTIGLRMGNTGRPGACDIALLCNYDVRTADSPRWFVRIQDGAVVSARSVSHGANVPWDCAWKSAESYEGRQWQFELRIPYRSLPDVSGPRRGTVWRSAITLVDSPVTSRGVVAQWGASDAASPQSGAVLEFQ